MKCKTLCFVVMFTMLLGTGMSVASMIHIPTTYGLSARGIAMGNAVTAITDDVGLPYFNPAAMAMTNESQLGISYMYAQPNFEGGVKGGEKDTFDVANKVVSTGIILSMDEFLKSNRKIALGLNITLDDNAQGFIRFDDLAYENGYYGRYGQASFLFNAGLGFEVVKWLYLGGGVLATLHSKTDFYVDTDLAGETKDEGMKLTADIYLAPVAALYLHFDPVSVGFAFRGEMHGEMTPIVVNASTNVGGSKLIDLPMTLYFLDSFVPASLSLGVTWRITDEFALSLVGDWYHWGNFDDVMINDDMIREDIDMDWVDTYVPRIGGEYQVVENLFLRFGYYYEQSPLRKPGSDGNYILDNDKHVGSLGLGYDLDLGILNYPLSIDAAYFHDYLAHRQLESADGTELESQGSLNGGIATVTLRF